MILLFDFILFILEWAGRGEIGQRFYLFILFLKANKIRLFCLFCFVLRVLIFCQRIYESATLFQTCRIICLDHEEKLGETLGIEVVISLI